MLILHHCVPPPPESLLCITDLLIQEAVSIGEKKKKSKRTTSQQTKALFEMKKTNQKILLCRFVASFIQGFKYISKYAILQKFEKNKQKNQTPNF